MKQDNKTLLCLSIIILYKKRQTYFLSHRLHYSLEQSMETIVPSVTNPADVAIDSLYEHLYWTERIRGGGIGRCNYDGSNITVIMKEDYIWSVTLDLENRFVYITNVSYVRCVQ